MNVLLLLSVFDEKFSRHCHFVVFPSARNFRGERITNRGLCLLLVVVVGVVIQRCKRNLWNQQQQQQQSNWIAN